MSTDYRNMLLEEPLSELSHLLLEVPGLLTRESLTPDWLGHYFDNTLCVRTYPAWVVEDRS